ncbi:hypothetical protein LJR030_001539 [Rhizobium sp. LjRoot30]
MPDRQIAENPEGLSFAFERSAYDIVRSATDTGRNFSGKLFCVVGKLQHGIALNDPFHVEHFAKQ